jgi:hypothetical protein
MMLLLPLRNYLGVISRPAINNITIADISPICLTVSSRTTRGSPLKIGIIPPNEKGPTITSYNNTN